MRTDVVRTLVDGLIAAGVHGLSPLGSTGEFPYLDSEQRLAVVRAVVEAVDGRVPVIPGVGGFSTREAVAQAQAAVEAGAEGLVVILQQYFPLKPADVEGYFTAVAEAVDVPLCVYTNPGLLGAELSLESIERLSDIPTIAYIKDASPDTGRVLSILNRCGDRLRVFSASSHIPLLVLQLGGVGWMGGPACVLPRECVALYDLAVAQRWEDALELQRELWPIHELFRKYSLAPCIKAALELDGIPAGAPIAPQPPLGSAARDEISASLKRIRARTAPLLAPAGTA